MISQLILRLSALVILVLLGTSDSAFSQSPYWARNAGGATTDEAADISIDAEGNTYTTGHFTASASFGTLTLSSSGVTDVFICKTDPSGYYQWAIKAGGTGSDRALSIRTDNVGNSYITGFFYGTAIFGTETLISSGAQDLFVAKYDNAGTFLWATGAGGAGSDIGNAVYVDNSGNVFITGEFAGTASFGTQSLNSMNGSVDVFTAKLDANGNFLWAKKGSAHATDRGIDVACDPQGNVYVTGQFTDTITFDNVHFNSSFNAIFVVKYNSAGEEQWFRRAGAAALNLVHGIAADSNSDVFISGDYTGNLIFFGTPNTTLNDPYTNGIFIAKYSSSGALLWKESDGSDGELTSRNLTIDHNDNPVIVGNFKCALGSYSDQYGEGTFNSVGFWDVFVAQYSNSGQWQWSRSLGGPKDDSGNGITINSEGHPIIAGSYLERIFLPVSSAFQIHNTVSVEFSAIGYCNDPYYGNFRELISAGNSDAFITSIFDTDREPYDYYVRSGSGCDRPYVGVCIGGSSCPDTVTFCGSGVVSRYSNVIAAGPDFTYQWSNGSTGTGISVGQSGYVNVTQTTIDGCFVSEDSIYVVIDPNPPKPLISDNLVVNSEALNPEELFLCAPDSVLLTGSGYGSNTPNWTGPISSGSAEVWVTEEGVYTFSYIDQNGCLADNEIEVNIDSLFSPIVPEMVCWIDTDENDSIALCEGQAFLMYIYDTISNPEGDLQCIQNAEVFWNVTPGTISYSSSTLCTPSTSNNFAPEESGEYLIEATVLRINHCDTDEVQISRTIYVELYPLPIIEPLEVEISGQNHICPGDSTLLVASEAPNYQWVGPGIGIVYNDSVWVSEEGVFTVSTGVSDTSQYGCIASVSDVESITITISSQPLVEMTPANGVICPNDSVLLECTGTGDFQWQGSSGTIGENLPSVLVNEPGTYYCILTDEYGCEIVSNSVEIDQYATPLILLGGSPILCEGQSIQLSTVTSPGSVLSWQPPLSGSDPEQTVDQPGVYTCLVSSCGIQTPASVEILASDVMAEITVLGQATVCEGDTVLLQANSGQSSYEWNPTGSQEMELMVHQSGTFTVTAFDATGCSMTSEPITVTMVVNTVMPPLVNDTAICPNGYAELTALAMANGTVYWYEDELAEMLLEVGPVFTTPNLEQSITYFVQQKSAFCPSDLAPVIVSIDDCEGIEVSNVFSPNGDGINDVFYFPQKGGTCFDCSIYNRWGRLLYRWQDANDGWDGTIQISGASVKDGVYYYILNFCDYAEKPISETGFIQVLGSR